MLWPPSEWNFLACLSGGLFVWVVSRLAGTGQCHPNSEGSAILCCRLLIDLNNSVWSKVFERLVFVHLGRYMECSGVLPTTQFAYRKCLGTCDAHLCVSHTLQRALESGLEARIVLIDFCAAFARVNYHGILSTVSIKLITALYGGWMSE